MARPFMLCRLGVWGCFGRPDLSLLFTLTASLMRREGLRFCVSAADLFAAAERLHGLLLMRSSKGWQRRDLHINAHVEQLALRVGRDAGIGHERPNLVDCQDLCRGGCLEFA